MDGFRESPSLLLLAVRDYTDAGLRRMLHTLCAALRHNRHLRRASHTGADHHRRITPPTLVVHGQRDPVVSQQWAQTVAGLATDGTLVTVPDAPHALNYTAPAALADVAEPSSTGICATEMTGRLSDGAVRRCDDQDRPDSSRGIAWLPRS